jgi:hypothetical protein
MRCVKQMWKWIFIMLTYKHEHEKNMTRLWCEISVEQTKRNEGSYSNLYPFQDLVQGNLQESFYVCIK